MKKSLFSTFKPVLTLPLPLLFALALTGCGPSLQSQLDMKVSIEPQQIELSRANGFNKTAVITYAITNNSQETLAAEDYEMTLGIGRPDDLSTVLFTMFSQAIAPGATIQNTYQKQFSQIKGEDGDHEIRFSFSRKRGDSAVQIKQVTTPVKIVHGS